MVNTIIFFRYFYLLLFVSNSMWAKVCAHIFAPGFENINFLKLLWLSAFTCIIILFYKTSLPTDLLITCFEVPGNNIAFWYLCFCHLKSSKFAFYSDFLRIVQFALLWYKGCIMVKKMTKMPGYHQRTPNAKKKEGLIHQI